MKYIIYLTTNKINNKIYVGVHKTKNPDIFDGYLGCGVLKSSPKTYMNGGTLFQRAVKKYGVNQFYRITLHICNTLEEAEQLEAQIVNEEFIKRSDTYNMVLGGNIPPDLSKTVYQFDLNGNLIKEWKNQIQVTEYYKCYKDAIYESIKHKRSFKDCYWSNDDTINIEDYRLNITNKFTYQYNKDGVLLNTFETIQIASDKLDIDKQRIINALAQKSSVEDCYFLPANVDIFEVLEWRKSKNSGKKIVYRYTLDGKYDRFYDSVSDAARDVGLKSRSSIVGAIKSFGTSAGYKWSFIKSDTFKEVTIYNTIETSKIAVYDKETNEFIEEFETVSECIKKYPYCRRVLRGERKSSHGCIFKYIS